MMRIHLLVLALLASVSQVVHGQWGPVSPVNPTASPANTVSLDSPPSPTPAVQPLRLDVFAPSPGDIVGLNGLGWVVDLAIEASNPSFNSILSPANGYSPAFLNPLNATQFHVGTDSANPGLVVLMSCTANPATNFAGVFQINGVS
jgi:hypothetical protein